MKVDRINSPKHRGSVFLKERDGEFICKVYAGQHKYVAAIQKALKDWQPSEEEGGEGLDNEV